MNNNVIPAEDINLQDPSLSQKANHTYPCAKKLYNDLLTRMIKNVEASWIGLFIGDEKSFELVAEVNRSNSAPQTEKDRLGFEQSTTSRAFATSRVKEAYEKKGPLHFEAQNPSLTRSVCQPIFKEQTVSGVLYFELKTSVSQKSEELEQWFLLWAEQASHTLESANQICDLEQQNLTKTQALIYSRKTDHSINLKRMEILSEMNSELRIPLNTIVGYGQLLKKKGARLDLPASFCNYLENICTSGYRLAELMDNIFDYAGFDSGKKPINKEEIDLRLFIRSVYHAAKTDARQKAVKISYQYDDELPDSFLSDRSALYQALQALLKQAVRKAKTGSSLVLSGEVMDEKLHFKIRNIRNPQRLGKTSANSTTNQASSAPSPHAPDEPNFEIAVAQKIITLLKGELIKDRDGCLYSVTLPYFQSKIRTEENQLPGKAPLYSASDKMLVLGKDSFITQTLQLMLSDLGATPVFLNPILEPPESLSELNANAVIVDFSSLETKSERDEIIKTLKQIAELPLVVVTENQHEDYRVQEHCLNLQEVISTPLNFKKLTSALKNCLKTDQSTLQPEGTEPGQRLNDIPTSSHQLPENLESELLADLDKLIAIPIYKGNTLITKLRKMMFKCRGYQSRFFPILKKMELALFDGNNDLFNKLIAEAKSIRSHKKLHQFS